MNNYEKMNFNKFLRKKKTKYFFQRQIKFEF